MPAFTHFRKRTISIKLSTKNILQFTPSSIYCPSSDIHIDPWRPVEKAIITHAHSDHARWGCKHYLAHKDSETILRMRLGQDISLQTLEYGERFTINGTTFSLHPAGHIIGSAQVRVEQRGEVWVASGDYKLENDGFSTPFESVPCHSFITESTFGLPIYRWPEQETIFTDIKDWITGNSSEKKTSILMGYSLGKMQRIITNLKDVTCPIYAHGAVFNLNEKLREAGFALPYIPKVSNEIDKKSYRGALILAPGSVRGSSWVKKFEPYSLANCSGWMAVRGAKNHMSVDRGFVLSDHADWNGLNQAVTACGAEQVFVTHGYTDVFSRWLSEKGISAHAVETMYGDDETQDGLETREEKA